MPTEAVSRREYLWSVLQVVTVELTLEYSEEMRRAALAPVDDSNQPRLEDALAQVARTAAREKRELANDD